MTLIQPVADRPGHDFRYAVDWTKLRDLGWTPETGFERGARNDGPMVCGSPGVVDKEIKERSREFQRFYEQNYKDRR